MADVVNLRQFRKRKQREDREEQADKNRKAHGVSSKVKKLSAVTQDIEARKLDGKKLTPEE